MTGERWDGIEPFREWLERNLEIERAAQLQALKRKRAKVARRKAEAERSQP